MIKKIILFICLIFTFLSHATKPVVIGSKNFSEGFILTELVSILLEEKFNQPVARKLGLGGTKVAFDALVNDNIDLYGDYTGTGYVMILKMKGERDPDEVFKIVDREFQKNWDIKWMPSLGFNNTYTVAVRRDDERFKNINTISELPKDLSRFIYGAGHEFMERTDGHKAFIKDYNLKFDGSKIIAMNSGLMYSAIRDKKLDLIVAYSTDGRIRAYNLKTLKDDRNFFPPYYASFIVKNKTLKKFPVLNDVFEITHNLITENEMMEMNYLVDSENIEPRLVAKNYLIKKGLIEGSINLNKKKLGLIKYFWTKRSYLIKLLFEHLSLSFWALSIASLISIPLGVLLTRYKGLSKFVFPIINTIQTIPSLALLGFLIPLIGIGKTPSIIALLLYSLLPLIRNTYSGIDGVDERYVEASRGIGLTDWQILMRVEIPLAMPIILAGFRTAAVIVIGTATIAALIGAGGFGDPIFRGVATVNSNLILLGAIPAALLAVITDKLISIAENLLVSKGLR